MSASKSQKQPVAGLMSANALATVLRRDRGTIARLLVDIPVAEVSGGKKLYRLADVQSLLAAKPDKSLRDEKLGEEIRKLKLRNDKEERLVIPRADVAAAIMKFLSPIDNLIEQKLVNEWPAAVAGMDVPQARIYGRRLGDDIRACFRGLSDFYPA